MTSFTFEAHIPRTIFGRGTLSKLPEEVERCGGQRAVIVTESTARQLDISARIGKSLGSRMAGVCSLAVMHTPQDVTLKALEEVQSLKADCLISLGGGSSVGLGKALSIRTGLPHIAIPTTYAGSEATPILGETVDGLKTTRSDPAILPKTIIYDVDLTLTLPQQLTYTSGINAIAHCVEALYSPTVNPVIEGLALTGIGKLSSALRALKTNPSDMNAREDASSGAWAAGVCLGHVGMAIHHKLCHTLGGSFGLPHAEVHTVILPHAMAYNAGATPKVMKAISRAMPGNGSQKVSAARAMWDLEKELGTVQSLEKLGMKREDLEKAADIASKAQYPNPAPLVPSRLLTLLEDAFNGNIPPEE